MVATGHRSQARPGDNAIAALNTRHERAHKRVLSTRIACGETHDDCCQWLDEEDGKEEMFRDGTCTEADELRSVEPSVQRQRSERRQYRLQYSKRDADRKWWSGWARFLGFRGRAAAVRQRLGDRATTILIVLVIWASCALLAAGATRFGAGLPSRTLSPTAMGQGQEADDGREPAAQGDHDSRMRDIPGTCQTAPAQLIFFWAHIQLNVVGQGRIEGEAPVYETAGCVE